MAYHGIVNLNTFGRRLMSSYQRWLALLPAYGWLLLFGFTPFFIMFAFSFLNVLPTSGREASFTLQNYARFFERAVYQQLTVNSLLLGLGTTIGCLVLGYPLALALAQTVRGRWKGALFLLIIVPFWSSSLVRLYAWVILLQNNGVLAQTFGLLGIQIGSLLYTVPAVLLGMIHAFLPYMVLTIYIAIDRIDSNLFNAAASLGATPSRTFFRVLLPLSMPGVISGSILVFIPAVGAFVEPRLLGGPRGQVLGTVIEDLFVGSSNWPQGAALAFILLLIVLALMGTLAIMRRVWSINS
jgi:spermidine/putrescine transport system permease protein